MPSGAVDATENQPNAPRGFSGRLKTRALCSLWDGVHGKHQKRTSFRSRTEHVGHGVAALRLSLVHQDTLQLPSLALVHAAAAELRSANAEMPYDAKRGINLSFNLLRA